MSLYQSFKKAIVGIVPRSLLFKYEYRFRSLLYILYIGNKRKCNICDKGLSRFIEEQDSLCPNCGSIARTRRLYDLLNKEFLQEGMSVLDFSPSRSLYRKLKQYKADYVSSDLSGDFIADQSYDITNIDLKDNHFDLIVCYHVLEHVEHDLQAMGELIRVLKSGGVCLIQTPFKPGEIYENSEVFTKEDRLKHFGQFDHVRIYSVKGLKERLEEQGFKVEVRSFVEDKNQINGFKTEEFVLVCTKF